jgi:hypothetical protein
MSACWKSRGPSSTRANIAHSAPLKRSPNAQATELRNGAWSREQFVGVVNDYVNQLPNEVHAGGRRSTSLLPGK